MKAQEIIDEARRHLRTPFVHQGRLPGKALDCAGLVVVVARACGIDVDDAKGYGRSPNGVLESVVSAQSCVKQVLATERQPGDILLMRFAKEMQHVAICAGKTIIHSYQQVGMVCEHDLDELWASRIVRVYRFNGVEP